MEKILTVSLRPAYADTDQMGFIHHSNYVRFYENARWEVFRKLGQPYKKIEEYGVLMPVINMSCHFIKPAFYDDQLTIEVGITKIGNTKLKFSYKTFRNPGEMIGTGETVLAFIKKDNKKPCRIPAFIDETLLEKALV